MVKRRKIAEIWPAGTALRMKESFLEYPRGTVLTVVRYDEQTHHYSVRDDKGRVTDKWCLDTCYWDLAEGPW